MGEADYPGEFDEVSGMIERPHCEHRPGRRGLRLRLRRLQPGHLPRVRGRPVVARLDAHQRRLLELLNETEWRATADVFAQTSLYRSTTALAGALGHLAARGLAERRVTGSHRNRVTEWRLQANSQSHP